MMSSLPPVKKGEHKKTSLEFHFLADYDSDAFPLLWESRNIPALST